MLLKNVLHSLFFLFFFLHFFFTSQVELSWRACLEIEWSSPGWRTFHSLPSCMYVQRDYVESAVCWWGMEAKATCITKAPNGRRADCNRRGAGTESNRQIESDRLWCKSVIELFISPKNTSIINQRQSQACLLVRENNVGVAVGCCALKPAEWSRIPVFVLFLFFRGGVGLGLRVNVNFRNV